MANVAENSWCGWQTDLVPDEIIRIRAGDVALTRVPYFDIALDASVAGMTRAEVEAVSWAVPAWADADGKVLIGQALWVAESNGRVVVIDPCGAADDFLRTGPEAILHQSAVAGAMRAAGYPPERVDVVVLTHLDGIGMAAAVDDDGNWSPMFPNARVVMTRAELEYLDRVPDVSGIEALRALIAQGVVDGVADAYEVAPGVELELTGAHSPGHAIVRAGTGEEQVVLVGHLAISPLQVTIEMSPTLHFESDLATKILAALVDEARAERSIIAGPLWPAPGAAKVGPDGQLAPISIT